MNHLKAYKIFENKEETSHPGFPKTEAEVDKVCKKYDIRNYTINDDLSIDVKNDVWLHLEDLEYLPLNFNYVSNNFYCFKNRLISLVGSPIIIDGSFVSYENKLETLDGSPLEVGYDFILNDNNLMSLKGCPKKISGIFCIKENNLRTIDYLPDEMNGFEIFNNPIECIFREFIYGENLNDLVTEFNEYSIVRNDEVVWNRLKAFCNDFELDLPDINEVKEYYNII